MESSGVFERRRERTGAEQQRRAPRRDREYALSPFHCCCFALAGSRADRRRAGEAHHGAIADSIGRVFDHAVVRREAGGELDDAPRSRSIDTGLSSTRLSASTVAMESPLASKISALEGTLQHVGGGGDLQMDAGVVARHHLARAVVDDELHQRRAGARVDRLGRSLDRSAIGLVGMLGHA